jgi:hypothetical protein
MAQTRLLLDLLQLPMLLLPILVVRLRRDPLSHRRAQLVTSAHPHGISAELHPIGAGHRDGNWMGYLDEEPLVAGWMGHMCRVPL